MFNNSQLKTIKKITKKHRQICDNYEEDILKCITDLQEFYMESSRKKHKNYTEIFFTDNFIDNIKKLFIRQNEINRWSGSFGQMIKTVVSKQQSFYDKLKNEKRKSYKFKEE